MATKRKTALPATTAERERSARLAAELNRTALSPQPINSPIEGIARLGAALAGNAVEAQAIRREQEAKAEEERKAADTRQRLARILQGDFGNQAGAAAGLPGARTPDIAPPLTPQATLGEFGFDEVRPPDPVDPNQFLLGGAAGMGPSSIASELPPGDAGGAPQRPLGASLRDPPAGLQAGGSDPGRRRLMAAALAGIPGMENKAVELALQEDKNFAPIGDPTQYGLPKGTVAQLGPNGQIHIVNKPEKPSAPTVHTFYDDKGNEIVKQWDASKGDWVAVGGSKRMPADKEDRQLVEIFDETSPTGTKFVRRSDAEGKPGKPSANGIEVMGPDGKVVARIGGKGGKDSGMAAPAAAELDKQILGNQARMQTVGDVVQSFRPEYLQIGTQLRNKYRAVKGKVLGADSLSPEDQQSLGDFATFRSRAFRDLNGVLKEMSGTAITPQEADRQLKVLADAENDDPVSFKAKLDDTVRFIGLSHARMLYARRNGLDPRATPMREVENEIEKRGKAIDAELQATVPDQRLRQRAIKAQLKQEFGI